MAKSKKAEKPKPIEQVLWASADKLRKNMDAAEYKHIVLGLIFLKYISDNFYELFHILKAGKGEYAGSDPDDPYEYRAENVFTCLRMPGEIICKAGQNLFPLAKTWTMLWMPLKRIMLP